MRVFGPDYDHAAVARWLRREAMKGFQRGDDVADRQYAAACSCAVVLDERQRKGVSVILTRDNAPGYTPGWHLSICCVWHQGFRGYVPEEGEYWRRLVFGPYADRALEQPESDRTAVGIDKDSRHWAVICDWTDRNDPAVNLEGL